jgi:hypothetical protein
VLVARAGDTASRPFVDSDISAFPPDLDAKISLSVSVSQPILYDKSHHNCVYTAPNAIYNKLSCTTFSGAASGKEGRISISCACAAFRLKRNYHSKFLSPTITLHKIYRGDAFQHCNITAQKRCTHTSLLFRAVGHKLIFQIGVTACNRYMRKNF